MTDELKGCISCDNGEFSGFSGNYWCHAYRADKNVVDDCPKWEPNDLVAMTIRAKRAEEDKRKAETMVERLIKFGSLLDEVCESEIKYFYSKMDYAQTEWRDLVTEAKEQKDE